MASKVEILGGQLDGATLDNAATESTLRELVEAIKKLEGTTRSSGSGNSSGGGKSSSPEINTNPANAALDSLGKGAAAVAGGLGKLGGAALGAAGSVAKSLGNMAGLISNGTNDLSHFVNALGTLPGPLGTFASVVASGISVLEKYQEEQRKLATIGASFNNSMMELRMTAARSGLSLSEFATVLKHNSQSIGGLGDTITDGAKKLADVGNAVGASGLDEEFMKLGMSSQSARMAAMKFSTELVKGDKVRSASANELASASLDYEKDLDLLAKQTGKSKDQLRAFSEGLVKDGGALTFAFAKMSPQMQAAMKGIMDRVGNTMGKGAQDALADALSGAAAPSTTASAQFQAQMPGVVAVFKQMKETAEWDAKSTEEKAAKAAKMDSLNAEASFQQLKFLQTKQGQFQMQNIEKLPAAQQEFMRGLQAQAKSLSEQGIDINTASKADIERAFAAKRAEQERQNKLDEGFNKFQSTITKLFAAVQSAFFGALAPRLEAFAAKIVGFTSSLEGMGISVETIIPVIGYLADLFGTVLGSVFEGVALVGTKIYNAFESLMSPVLGLLESLGLVDSTATDTAGKFGELVGVVVDVSNVIFDVLGGAIDFLAVIIGGVISGFTGLVNMTKFLFNMFGITGDSLNGLKDIGKEILNAIRGVFSKEGATAIVESISSLFNLILGGLLVIIGKIPFLSDLKTKGQEMLDASDRQKQASEAAGAAMQGEVDKRNANVNAQNDAAKKEIAGSNATYRQNAELAKKELADRKAREAADAESAATRKNALKDQASADAMERSKAAAIKNMRERAGITDEKRPVAPSPGMGGTVPGAAGPGTPVQTDAEMAKYLQSIALIESGGNKDAKAGTSSASGLFQFTKGTWEQMTKEMGKNYSLDDRFDPKKATEVAAFFSQKQKAQLEKGTGREANSTDMYMSHFLGAGGATKFLNAMGKDPNQSAASLDPKAAAANKNIYYTKEGTERTVAEVYALMDKKVKGAEGAVAAGKWGGKAINADVASIAPGNVGTAPATQTAGGTTPTPTPVVTPAPNPKVVNDWAWSVFSGKADPSMVPEQYRSAVNNILKTPPVHWAQAAGKAPAVQTAAKSTPVGNTVPNGQNTSLWSRLTSSTPAAPTDQAAKDQAAKDQAAKGKPGETAMAQAAATNPITEVIASLNTSLAQLTMLQGRAVSIAEQQLRATNGLSRDAYKAV